MYLIQLNTGHRPQYWQMLVKQKNNKKKESKIHNNKNIENQTVPFVNYVEDVGELTRCGGCVCREDKGEKTRHFWSKTIISLSHLV